MIEPFSKELAKTSTEGTLRALRLVSDPTGRTATVDGKQIVLFSSNNYLGLANHPIIIEAVIKSVEKYGWGSGASRLVSGTMPPHIEFEEKVADFLNKPQALMFSSGYTANVGVITSLMGRKDNIFADRLCHASVIDGARFSGARLKRFRHNDPDDLLKLIKKTGGKGKLLIVTDGVFSMDGDMAPLKELAHIAERFGALFMVDDAHGFGLFGPQGRGTPFSAGVSERVDIHVATLGKALGGSGGFVAGSKSLIDGLINFSRPFIYSTAIPPATACAGVAALDIISSEQGERRRKALHTNAGKIMAYLNNLGYDTGKSRSQIIPVYIDGAKSLGNGTGVMLEMGVFAPFIKPPTVPKGANRFRICVTADHNESDLAKLESAFRRLKEI
ncbi:8-amino-7-oxononanoate synthase [hydrothermal vent metagenome]|uniref:8-amino-7-oxononanoate synthase n=1 Tax=hydrothermal vent metagenome TaxID=652676 RepID=A0A3B1CSY1_9ZZZZ